MLKFEKTHKINNKETTIKDLYSGLLDSPLQMYILKSSDLWTKKEISTPAGTGSATPVSTSTLANAVSQLKYANKPGPMYIVDEDEGHEEEDDYYDVCDCDECEAIRIENKLNKFSPTKKKKFEKKDCL